MPTYKQRHIYASMHIAYVTLCRPTCTLVCMRVTVCRPIYVCIRMCGDLALVLEEQKPFRRNFSCKSLEWHVFRPKSQKIPIFPQKIMVTFYILYFLFFSHRPYFSFVASFRALNAAVTDKNTRCRYGVFQILGDECIDRHQQSTLSLRPCVYVCVI